VPQPVSQQLHVDRYLTNMAIAWSQDQANFISDKVFPVVPVMKESDFYAVYNRAYFYRDEMQIRPLGGRPPEAGYEVTHQRYNCLEWALEDKIDDRIRANADQPLDPDLSAMRLLTGQALIHRDKLWQEAFFKTGVWEGGSKKGTQSEVGNWVGNETAGTSAEQEVNGAFTFWDIRQANGMATGNASGCEPIAFIESRKLEVASQTGYMPNTLVLGASVYKVLKNHPAVIERIKYTQRGIVTTDILASLFDVDRVLVPLAVINKAAEFLPSSTSGEEFGFVVSPKSAMLCYAAPAPTIQAPSAGYTFAYTGLIPGVTNAFGGIIQRGREELAHSDVIQIRASYTQVATSKALGIFISEAVKNE